MRGCKLCEIISWKIEKQKIDFFLFGFLKISNEYEIRLEIQVLINKNEIRRRRRREKKNREELTSN